MYVLQMHLRIENGSYISDLRVGSRFASLPFAWDDSSDDVKRPPTLRSQCKNHVHGAQTCVFFSVWIDLKFEEKKKGRPKNA